MRVLLPGVGMVRKSLLAFGFLGLFAPAAMASPITVDATLYNSNGIANPGLLSGTVDMSYSGGVLTILLRNTSADAAGLAADVLLTGIGFQLPEGVTLLPGGAAYIGSTSSSLSGLPGGTNISSEWGYDASPLHSGVFLDGWNLSYNTVVSAMSSQTTDRFAGGSLGGSPGLAGPDYGAISASETSFPGNQDAILDLIRITLKLGGATDGIVSRIDAGNVGLSFGSPSLAPAPVPEPGSLSLLALGFGAAGAAIRRRRRQA